MENKGYDKEPNAIEMTVPNGGPEAQPEKQSEGFGNKIEFLLAMVGYAVGLGTVWRFPYLAQRWGGGAFMIPYLIMLVTMGLPLYFLEMAIGQRIRQPPLTMWYKIAKPFAGLGFAAVSVSFFVGLYYTMIIAWSFYYLFVSFAAMPHFGRPCSHYADFDVVNNVTIQVDECVKGGETQYYWWRIALEATGSIDESGGLNWKMTLCLLLSWVVIFGSTVRGMKSMGKVVYFTALFPYVVLTIFFIYGCTLPGAINGVKQFLPNAEAVKKLGDIQMWIDAAAQILYSFSLSFGGVITMSAGNDIHNNCERDAVILGISNCLTAIYAGIVVFSVLGFKATYQFEACVSKFAAMNMTCTVQDPKNGKMVEGTLQWFLEQSGQGTGLTFVAFTEAIRQMPVPWLWSILFFIMLLTLGMGTMMGTFITVRQTIVELDFIPIRSELIGGALCAFSFVIGLVFCQRSGSYWVDMFDSHVGNIPLLLIAILEVIIIVFIYGFKRFNNDIEFMLGRQPNWYWKICWVFITPAMIAVVTIYFFYDTFSNRIQYTVWDKVNVVDKKGNYPAWAEALSIFLMFVSVLFIPIVALLVKFDMFNLKGFTSDADGTAPESTEKGGIPKSISTMPLSEFEGDIDRV